MTSLLLILCLVWLALLTAYLVYEKRQTPHTLTPQQARAIIRRRVTEQIEQRGGLSGRELLRQRLLERQQKA